jgi:hypothetical protein
VGNDAGEEQKALDMMILLVRDPPPLKPQCAKRAVAVQFGGHPN